MGLWNMLFGSNVKQGTVRRGKASPKARLHLEGLETRDLMSASPLPVLLVLPNRDFYGAAQVGVADDFKASTPDAAQLVAPAGETASASPSDSDWIYVPVRRFPTLDAGAVTGRITSIAVDPSGSAMAGTYGRGAYELFLDDAGATAGLVESEPATMDSPGVGFLQSIDGGLTWAATSADAGDDNNHGTHTAGTIAAIGNNGVALSHELGHVLGFRHEHTRPE